LHATSRAGGVTAKVDPALALPGLLATLALTSITSTAGADQPAAPIIPEQPQKADATELAAPYEAWRGSRHPPAGARRGPDRALPAPLARAPELPRRPLEATFGGAAFLPSCSAGSLDDRGCVTLQPGAGFEGALLYRVGPFFAAGAEAALSGFGRRGQGALSRAGGGGGFVGVVGRVYFAESGSWDPYVSLALGYGALRLNESAAGPPRAGSSGFGARVAGGIDFLLGSRLRLGPTLGFAHFIAWSEQHCSGAVCRDGRASYGRLLGFATLGLRATASFGDAL
jgi:hypothetical protein